MAKASSPRYPTFVIHEGYDRALSLESVGAGWASLVNEVFDFIEQNNIKNVKVIQVKEKWGGLRIYTDFMHDALDQKIRDVETRSFETCEVTGKPGQLRSINGWYRTLCDEEAMGNPPINK